MNDQITISEAARGLTAAVRNYFGKYCYIEDDPLLRIVNSTLSEREKELRAQLDAAREALQELMDHRVKDSDGTHICWIGETTFELCEKALQQLTKENK